MSKATDENKFFIWAQNSFISFAFSRHGCICILILVSLGSGDGSDRLDKEHQHRLQGPIMDKETLMLQK